VHALRGSRYKLLLLLLGLLLLNNLTLAVFAFADYKFFDQGVTSLLYILCISIGLTLLDLTVTTSHLLLAFQYRKIASDIPRMLDDDVEEIKKSRAEEYCYTSLGILIPILEAFG
jgi:hypothetical protein